MSGPLLQAKDLAWSFGAHYVLLDLDLALAAGELVVLRGDNGAGKTTLLHLLAGRMRPASGAVELHGAALPTLDPGYVGSQVGWLGHKPGLYLDLTAIENLLLFARISGVFADRQAAATALSDAGLAARDHDRPVRAFSRGMKQRAALARVAIGTAPVWLLDEPTTGLDATGRADLLRHLRRHADDGRAIFAATHDEELAEAADRLLLLAGGRLEEVAR